MFRKAIIGQAVVLLLQMFLPCTVSRNRGYECMEGCCAMDACPYTEMHDRSTYCWIAADSSGRCLECARAGDCREAATNWGNCRFLSCNLFRAPHPRNWRKTCEYLNQRKVRALQSSCRSFSFDHWTREYSTPKELITQFEPCKGDIIEDETKKVIMYCHCYNFCGQTQTERGDCKVQGLDRRLDHEANVKTTYQAICAIDCEPTDEYVFMTAYRNSYDNPTNFDYTITTGMTSSKTTSTGGSGSVTVSAEVGATIFKKFSVSLGVSRTTGFDWSSSSAVSEFEQRSTRISVPVDPGDEVTLYQVIGKCTNSDGTTYTIKTRKYETRGGNDHSGSTSENGSTSEQPSEE